MTPLIPLYALVHILDDLPPFPQLRTHLMDGLFINQKKEIRTFEYRIHWDIIIRKKILYEKVNGSVGWNKHSGEQY